MSLKLLTNLIFEPKGVHDPALTYSIKDTVMSPDGSKVYFALRDVPSGIALTDKNYWMLQIDLSGSKNAMDEAVAAFADYAKIVGTRVKGETAKAAGNPVSFLPDAGSLLQPVTVLEPQQEGSGEPYPAGGGRNLCVLPDVEPVEVYGITYSCSNGVVKAKGTATAHASTLSTISYRIPKGTSGTYFVSGTSGNVRVFIRIEKDGTLSYPHQRSFTLDGTETNVMLFIQVDAGYTADDTIYPMLNAGTTALPWEAPSNIRPFTGWDVVKMNHAGKNLAHLTFRDVIPSVVSGNDVAVSAWASDYIFIGENNVVLSRSSATNATVMYLLLYDSAKKYIGYVSNSIAGAASKSVDVSGHENARYCRVRFDEKADTDVRVQLELGSASSDFQPYTNTLHDVQIGQTVYGIRYEWLTGKAWIEWIVKNIVSAADIVSSYKNKDGTALICVIATDAIAYAADVLSDVLSSHFAAVTSNDQYLANGNSVSSSGGNVAITVKNVNAIENMDVFLAAQHAAGTPVQITYKLAKPVEIQLTPHIISAADPEQTNTLYGDGSIEVEYVKPLHVSIEERVAAIASAMLMKEE